MVNSGGWKAEMIILDKLWFAGNGCLGFEGEDFEGTYDVGKEYFQVKGLSRNNERQLFAAIIRHMSTWTVPGGWE